MYRRYRHHISSNLFRGSTAVLILIQASLQSVVVFVCLAMQKGPVHIMAQYT